MENGGFAVTPFQGWQILPERLGTEDDVTRGMSRRPQDLVGSEAVKMLRGAKCVPRTYPQRWPSQINKTGSSRTAGAHLLFSYAKKPLFLQNESKGASEERYGR